MSDALSNPAALVALAFSNRTNRVTSSRSSPVTVVRYPDTPSPASVGDRMLAPYKYRPWITNPRDETVATCVVGPRTTPNRKDVLDRRR
jgi:hypothetical protein